MRRLMMFPILMSCACSSHTQAPTQEQNLEGAKKAFAAFDLNHDGVISRQEWTVMALKAAAEIPRESQPQYVRDSLRVFLKRDKDGDGKVTLTEYIANNSGEDAT